MPPFAPILFSSIGMPMIEFFTRWTRKGACDIVAALATAKNRFTAECLNDKEIAMISDKIMILLRTTNMLVDINYDRETDRAKF